LLPLKKRYGGAVGEKGSREDKFNFLWVRKTWGAGRNFQIIQLWYWVGLVRCFC